MGSWKILEAKPFVAEGIAQNAAEFDATQRNIIYDSPLREISKQMQRDAIMTLEMILQFKHGRLRRNI